MSIFSVLRYPISSPPWPEELKALPPALFLLWVHMSEWKDHYGLDIDETYIANWYQDHWEYMEKNPLLHPSDMDDIETLRRLIRDYEE